MAEVIGFLRDDATHIEKHIWRLPGRHLPDELTVYVESPVYGKQYSRAIGQSREEDDYAAVERRVLSMAMGRAREKLCMSDFCKLPRLYEDLRRHSLPDFVGRGNCNEFATEVYSYESQALSSCKQRQQLYK